MENQKQCSVLTDSEIRSVEPATLYRLHKERKPFIIDPVYHGAMRDKQRKNKRKSLKKHIEKITGQSFTLMIG